MDVKFSAIVAKAQAQNDYDKLLRLITPQGIVNAVIKGVKRPGAKLKAWAAPFAFAEYTAAKRGNSYVITGASSIEDLFGICSKTENLTAGSIILEAAAASFGADSEEKFVYMLYRLKDIIYSGQNPYIHAIRFLQYMIHNSGYAYEYEKYPVIETPLQLLSHLHFYSGQGDFKSEISGELILKTLIKIISSFENRLDCEIQSKKLLEFAK